MEDLQKAAIRAAVGGSWKKAIEFNKKIISHQAENIQALNRLAFAQLQTRNFRQAKKTCQIVLKIDPNNPVAERNLQIAQQLDSTKINNRQIIKDQPPPKPDVFVKDSGKTREVILVNLTTQSILNTLYSSQEVKLTPTKKTIEVRTLDGYYIGALPDDISFHLKNLIKLGNGYSTHIKNIEPKRVCVFLRETKRGETVKRATFSSFG